MKTRYPAGMAMLAAALIAGCAPIRVQHEVQPIHITMDINVRVQRELENFFAFEQQYQPATTQSTTSNMSPTQAGGVQ